MVREKVTVSTRILQWKCVESRADSKRLYYGRFILAPLMKGQAMRRALLGEIEGTCITCAGELEFEEGTIGIALNLESNNVGVVLMGDDLMIQEGSSVKATGRIAQIPISEAFLGRVINALAKPIDGRGEISSSES